MLKDQGFPITRELNSLHCPPSEHAWSYNSMWAYGSHFSCCQENGPSSVAFDCGIAAIPPSPTATVIDVGILWNIIYVTYLGINCVVMEGSWIKPIDQGRRVVKKDSSGFWIVQYSSREIRAKDNPYVYPASVSQVFFLDDSVDPSWKVVLRHDPRSKRIEGDRDVIVFGAAGSSRPTLSSRSALRDATNSKPQDISAPVDEVPLEQYHAYLREEERPDDEHHLDDSQFEDEFELQHVE